MSHKILIINGHPDPSPARLCAALADAYGKGAREGGHAVRRVDVGAMAFPLVETAAAFTDGVPPKVIADVQQSILWADHLVVIYPLWLGGLPAKLKGFFEQALRYGFAVTPPGTRMEALLEGRSARIIVTMGMPAALFRVVFASHGLKAFERGMLWISGIRPIRSLVIGGVGGSGDCKTWLRKAGALGLRAR